MNHTLKQRSQLVQAAEFAHNQKERPSHIGEIVFAVPNPAPNRGDYLLAFVGIVGMVVIVILAAMGVV